MECNKAEAMKAKEIAEQKLIERDFENSKKFALKAERLYPSLEGVRQLLDTLEVYISSEKRTNGEVDWYGVLGVEKSADDETIKRQYRKLALVLHPDKNRSVGADGAFTIIKEAWGLLSDKVKRLAYDHRLNMSNTHAKVPDQRPGVPSGQNGYYNIFNNIDTWVRGDTLHPRPAPTSFSTTFWTMCCYCQTYFLFPRAFLNRYYPCQNCHLSFFTIEMQGPYGYTQRTHSTQHQRAEQPCSTGTMPDLFSYMQGVNTTQNIRTESSKPEQPCSTGTMPEQPCSTGTKPDLFSYMQGVNITQNSRTESSNTARTKPDQSSNMQGVKSPKCRRNENSSNSEAQTDPYMRPIVMGLASAKSGITVKGRSTSSAAESRKLKKEPGVASTTKKEEASHQQNPLPNETTKTASSATVFPQSGSGSASKEDTQSKKGRIDKQRKSNILSETRNQLEKGVGKVPECSSSKCIRRETPDQMENGIGHSAHGSSQKGIGREAVNKKGNGIGKFAQSSSGGGGFDIGTVSHAENRKPDVAIEFSSMQIRDCLKNRAQNIIINKLKEWGCLSTISKASEKETEKKEAKQNCALNEMKSEVSRCQESVDAKSEIPASKSSNANADENSNAKGMDSVRLMSVSDPDFHDFDGDRVERSFGKNQVWAAYDNEDGMPRLYAMINEVVSFRPFKLRISWLNSKSNQEFSLLNWVASGFRKTSGEFWIGKHTTYKALNAFSHKVNWRKGKKGVIQIYPSKGEVWAIYRNWSPDWQVSTPDDVIHKYDMVEVLEDYNQEEGVTVAFLVKIAGFKTLFRRHPDPTRSWRIPRKEMFRFSHQVPSHLLTGIEGHGAPEGCWELDPASVPLELLQVFNKIQEEEMVSTIKKADEKDSIVDAEKSQEENLKNEKPVEEEAQNAIETRKRKGKETEMEEKEVLIYKRKRFKNRDEVTEKLVLG